MNTNEALDRLDQMGRQIISVNKPNIFIQLADAFRKVIKDNEPGPLDHVPAGPCKREDCGGGCIRCTLFVCARCGGYEGGLTTHCPGDPVPMKRTELIYAGKLNFRGGMWITECSEHSPRFQEMILEAQP